MKNSVLCYLEETAKRLPDKVAFFDADKEITFKELRPGEFRVYKMM